MVIRFISLFLFSQSTAALDANREKSKGLFKDLPQHIKQNQDEGKRVYGSSGTQEQKGRGEKRWIFEVLMFLLGL